MRGPEALLSLVEGYAALGDHRTGTAVDHSTTTWLTGLLQQAGAEVTQQPYDFPRFEGAAAVLIDGVPVRAELLPYCWVGTAEDDDPERAALPLAGASDLQGLSAAQTVARQRGRFLVVATCAGFGRLTALNRPPRDPIGPVTVLIAEQEAAGLLSGVPLSVTARAAVVPGRTANLMAAWRGAPQQPHLLVTTPLTGWFGCAGERGSGLAIAVDVVEALAERWPVLLVATTGHELDGIGVAHYLSADGLRRPAAVLHVGASAAATGTRPGALSEHVRIASTDLELAGLAAGLALTGHGVHAADDVGWRGEAQAWATLDVPIASVAGATPLFHTPQDLLPEATTGPLLVQVRDGLLAAGTALGLALLG